jgi:SagB-type dehydrogenase family enzyme
VRFPGYSLALGEYSARAAARAQELHSGLPLASFVSSRAKTDKEIDALVRRLARHGLLEYRLTRARGEEQVIVEPQMADYWPSAPQLRDADVLVMSRFAYLRRRGSDMVLESPRAGALFNIRSPQIAALLATLSKAQDVRQLRRREGFPGLELLGLLLDCRILFKAEAVSDGGLRPAEGDQNLVLWDFHDLLFHARSTQGRHANPVGGVFPYVGVMPPLPAIRPPWPGTKIDLGRFLASRSRAISPAAQLLRDRHSTRSFDDGRPITAAELSQFLDSTARVLPSKRSSVEISQGGPVVEYAPRPYPAGGAAYELELYLAVDKCEGLERGFYHYDAGEHVLVAIDARSQELEASLMGAASAMGASAAPQILVTLAARFGRVSWKYSSLAYALILKDVGVLMQTLYLAATDMGLGGCAIGSTDIELFARMTGIEFHVEGPVGQFALGRPA